MTSPTKKTDIQNLKKICSLQLEDSPSLESLYSSLAQSTNKLWSYKMAYKYGIYSWIHLVPKLLM